MSDAHPATHADTAADHHDNHAAGQGGHDDDHGTGHGHETDVLGPVDLLTWAYAVGGIILGCLVAGVFIISTGRFQP